MERANNVYLLDEEFEVQACFLRYHDGKDFTTTTEVHRLFFFNEDRFETDKVLDVKQNEDKEWMLKVR